MTSNSIGRPWRTALVAVAIVTWLGGTAAVGCATGGDTEFDNTTSTSTSTSTSGGGNTGGGGAGGGTTTTTSTSMCDVDCSQIQTPDCQVSVCNEGQHRGTIGVCVVVPDEDGTPCDDGVFCTIDDACSAGICEGGPPNDCGMTPPQCTEVVCDEQSQTCTTAPAQNGAPCQDPNDLCMVGSTCSNGLCIGGTPEDCFFFPVPDDCHVAECNPQNGQCEPVVGNEGGPCSDPNDLCTVNKTCTAGVCQGGSPKDCSQLTVGCTMGVCDVNNGTCVAQSVGNGQPCDDLDHCTTGEICTNGTCGGGTPITACVNNDLCCPSNCTAQNDQDCAIPPGCMATAIPNKVICISNNLVNTYSSAAHCMACTEKGLTNACTTEQNCIEGYTNTIIEQLYFQRTGQTCTAQAQQGPSCGWGEIMTPTYQPNGVCPTPQDCTSSINWENCSYGTGNYSAYIYNICFKN